MPRSRTVRVGGFQWTPNPDFADDHKNDPKFQNFSFRLASSAARIARTHVPSGFMQKGSLQARLQGRRATTKLNAGANAQVVFQGSGWHLIEFGTPTTPPHAPLRKGIEAAGMRYQPRGGGEE